MWKRQPIIRFIWATDTPGHYLDKLSLPQKVSFCKRREARRDRISPAEIAVPRYALRMFGYKPGDATALYSRELQMWTAQRTSTTIILRNPLPLFAISLVLVGYWSVILVSALREEHFNVCLYTHSGRAGPASGVFLSHENGHLKWDLSTVEVFPPKASSLKFSLASEDS